MPNIPSQDIVEATEAGITRVTRRVEIFESDGVTPWYANGSEEDVFRLMDGSVAINSAQDERRSLDMTLDNKDNNLRPDPTDGFWYDKIIRPYRGVKYQTPKGGPRTLIIDGYGAQNIKSILASLGFTRIDLNLSATTLADLRGYDVIVALGTYAETTKGALIKDAYFHGFNVLTLGYFNGVGEIPYVTSEFAFGATNPVMITPVAGDTPVAGGWVSESEGSSTGKGITAIDATAVAVATSLNDSTTQITASLKVTNGARWFDYHSNSFGTNGKILIKKALNWLWNYSAFQNWETPLGDFVIDTINSKNFPKTLSIAARDQTKICLNSKLEKNMSFDSGTSVNDLITALAANAGIKKIRLNEIDDGVLGVRIDAARGDARWAIMKDAAAFLGRDLFFDLDGSLITQAYADPTLGAPLVTFKTGAGGNLASYERSTTDARIYNHIVVTGTSGTSDDTGLEFFGEAINDNPASPTCRAKLGDRTYYYTSAFFTSDAQCVTYAQKLLTQTAFEQYEVNLNSIVYPWIDAGIVAEFIDPDNIVGDPTRFLMDTATVPLGLGPMPATGKRVLFIESSPVETTPVAEPTGGEDDD